MKKIVVLTGAGVSAESGISTFRDAGGLWEGHRIEDVASPEGWLRNKEMVLEFYNLRRKQLYDVQPNAAHEALIKLESKFDVQIITQNVDDLHERAGSKNVMHLHGELKKVRSTFDQSLVFELDGWELKLGDKCPNGSQLRPHIVWFGEAVPMYPLALKETRNADILIVIGTSLVVYPAAGLLDEAPSLIPKFLVDPNPDFTKKRPGLEIIQGKAATEIPKLVERLINDF